MKTASLIKRWNALRSSYWFVPTLMALGAFVLFFVTITLDRYIGSGWIEYLGWFYANQPAGARAVLSTIAGSMITVAGVAFSITIAAVAYASAQFGPRLLSNFMQDRGNQITLGTFIATFLYCLLVLRTVHNPEEGPEGAVVFEGYVPQIAVLCSLFLALASIGVLIYFIHHVPESIHLPNVVAGIGHELNHRTTELYPKRVGLPSPKTADEVHADLPEGFLDEAFPVHAPDAGYLQAIDSEGLFQIAQKHDLLLRLGHRPGDFISQGKTLLLAWPPDRMDEELKERLLRSFAWGRQRNEVQNVLFLVDELIEVAARALSPGVNDPFTAMNCMDWLGSALSSMASREPPSPYRYDAEGHLRVITFPVTFSHFADAVFYKLRPYAEKDRNAGLHMMEMAAEVAADLQLEEHRRLLLQHVAALKVGCGGALQHEDDRKMLEQRYRTIQRILTEGTTPRKMADALPWLGGSG